MDLQNIILEVAAKMNAFGTADVLLETKNKYSRQYVSRLLKKLVEDGKLIRSGNTKNTQYSLPSNSLFMNKIISDSLDNVELNEDIVLGKVQKTFLGFSLLNENIQHIFNYAFSEILNNAIEHSNSSKIEYEVYNDGEYLGFLIKDTGVGVFANVVKTKELNSEIEAIQDILKGKTTTDKEKHSGEGIFFSSKAADLFIIDSHKLRLRIDNAIPDVFIEELQKNVEGTVVSWKIHKNSLKELAEIFKNYQSDETSFIFDKTSVLVKLFTLETEYVSRSQARRLLYGLEKFTKIILDFENVKTIGQGFADEIFRVFKVNNPKIKIEYINAIEPVEFMIRHTNI